jgi:hypothetical protein
LLTAWDFACSRAWVFPVLLGCAFHLPALFGELVYDDLGLILDHSARQEVERVLARHPGYTLARQLQEQLARASAANGASPNAPP